MHFSFIDKLLAMVCLLFTVLAAAAGAWYVTFLPLPQDFRGIIILLVFFFLLVLGSGLLMRIVRAFIPLKEGTFDLSETKEGISWKLQGFLYVFNLGLLINTYLVPVNLRGLFFSFMGAKVGKNVMIGGKILEPPLVEIGNYSMLGEDTLIAAHAVEGSNVVLGKVKIGDYVTIGVKAVILPDVEIGNNSIVAAGAVVIKGTNILPYEIWGGVPAKKIGEVKSKR